MPTPSDEFIVGRTLDSATRACQYAIAGLGWRVESSDSHRVVAKIEFGGFNWPGKIETLLTETADGSTTVRLNGKIAGLGPIQKRHLTTQLKRLHKAIELAPP